jgi:hypothetical protein
MKTLSWSSLYIWFTIPWCQTQICMVFYLNTRDRISWLFLLLLLAILCRSGVLPLSHTPNLFCFSYFSGRVWGLLFIYLLSNAASDWYPPTYGLLPAASCLSAENLKDFVYPIGFGLCAKVTWLAKWCLWSRWLYASWVPTTEDTFQTLKDTVHELKEPIILAVTISYSWTFHGSPVPSG